MALPGLPYKARDGSEKRASAGNVARYYVQYMNEMKLGKYFKNGTCVTKVQQLEEPSNADSMDDLFGEYCPYKGAERRDSVHGKWVEKVEEHIDACHSNFCTSPEIEDGPQNETRRQRVCSLSNAFNFIRLRSSRKCKRRRDFLTKNDLSPDRKIREVLQKSTSVDDEAWKAPNSSRQSLVNHKDKIPVEDLCSDRGKCRSVSFSCDFDSFRSSCDDSLYSKSFNNEQGSFINPIRSSFSLNFSTKVPKALKTCDSDPFRLTENCDPCTSSRPRRQNCPKWSVETYDTVTGKRVTYLCKFLILANGANDLPNRLTISCKTPDPNWLLYDVRSLEQELDRYVLSDALHPDPVLVVGAGLSAADAIIATRCRNIPVLHLFRNKTSDLGKQLPENMYPEYHKVPSFFFP